MKKRRRDSKPNKTKLIKSRKNRKVKRKTEILMLMKTIMKMTEMRTLSTKYSTTTGKSKMHLKNRR
jgi:hypothetical protein